MRDATREVSLYRGPMPAASSAALAAHLLGKETSPTQAAVRAERLLRLQEALNALEPLADKWRAFGWQVAEADGHDTGAVTDALAVLRAGDGPAVLLAHTVKGKGVPFAEGDPAWHMGQLDAAQHRTALAALDGPAAAAPTPTLAAAPVLAAARGGQS